MNALAEGERVALARLLEVAQGPTHQSRRVADFLLAWWNAGSCGGFDFTSLWSLDRELAEHCVTVFRYVARNQHYPDALGYERQFGRIIEQWRPELTNGREHE